MGHLLTVLEGGVRVAMEVERALNKIRSPYVDSTGYRIHRVDAQGRDRVFDALELYDSENDQAWIMSDTARSLDNVR